MKIKGEDSLLQSIAEQRAAMDRLRELHEQVDDEYEILAGLMRLVPVLAVVANVSHFEYVNKRWTDVLGWTKEEMLGRPFIEFIHPADRVTTKEAVFSMMEGDIESFPNRYLHKDGHYVDLVWVASKWDKLGKCYAIAALREGDQARCLWHSCPLKVCDG